jgi:hypothetical protein
MRTFLAQQMLKEEQFESQLMLQGLGEFI